jgi:long-chain acyl-CoA synthetase
MNTDDHQNSEFISATVATSLPVLFELRVKKSPDQTAYKQYSSGTDTWDSYTWRDIYNQVCRWRQAMQQENLSRGDRVALMLANSIQWVCFDQAAQSLGLVVISLYTTDTPENIRYILSDAGARLLLVDDSQTWDGLKESCQSIDTLQHVWYLQDSHGVTDANDELLSHVNNILPEQAAAYTSIELATDELATIIYTSGTTGRPKGVMLSHRNILSNAEAVHKRIPALPEDVFLSFLPLAHAFERTVEYILPMMAGSCVSYARSISLLRDDLMVVRPTVFISAPRLYEKIYVAIQEKISGSRLKQKLFHWAVSLGWRQFLSGQGRGEKLNLVECMLLSLLQQLVSNKVLSKLGGRMRVAVTGAAPLSPSVSRFFIGLGLPLLEGYGLTEASPVVSGNNPEDNVPGSVGRPLPGVKVKLGDDGELLVRSDAVMMGYWQREEDTRQVIDEQGWLHTGDLAEIRDEHIYIIGRCKEILVMSTGKKVAPTDMETTIMLDPLFSNVMIIGEGKPFIAALLVLNTTLWNDLAEKLKVDPDDNRSLQDEKVIQNILNRLEGLLKAFPAHALVRAIHLSLEPWSIEQGLLTPTLKIKRNALEKKFSKQILELYRGHKMIK